MLRKSCFIASLIILILFIVTACNFEANAPGSIEIPAKPDEDPIPPQVTDPLPPTEDEKTELSYVNQAASIYTYTNESNTSVPTGDNSITIAGDVFIRSKRRLCPQKTGKPSRKNRMACPPENGGLIQYSLSRTVRLVSRAGTACTSA